MGRTLKSYPSSGLLSIIKICGLEDHNITIDDIVFKIGPRINAAGRMRMDENDENAAPSGGFAAVELLVEGNEKQAREFCDVIDSYNQDRKNIDRSVTQEAHDYIESHPEMKNRKSTVIYNPKWMKGIVGIVASRLIETYYRPTVVLTMSNGFVTGSARSVQGFDLYQAVESCSDLLVDVPSTFSEVFVSASLFGASLFFCENSPTSSESVSDITSTVQAQSASTRRWGAYLFFGRATCASKINLSSIEPMASIRSSPRLFSLIASRPPLQALSAAPHGCGEGMS